MPDAVDLIVQLGGVVTRRQLERDIGVPALRRALSAGQVERVARGRYSLPSIQAAPRRAVELAGVLSHRSAALTYGWGVRTEPRLPDVTLPRKRNVEPSRRRGARVHWRDLPGRHVDGWRTSPVRTVLDCVRDLELAEALAVADSALRSGLVQRDDLIEQVCLLPRTGRRTALEVLELADGRAANPFESSLRALSIEAVGPIFRPQQRIELPGGTWVRPDLVCRPLRIVAEADSYEFHTSRSRLRSDCHRYDELTLDGWLVMRFAWEHVMLEQQWTRQVLTRAVESRSDAQAPHRPHPAPAAQIRPVAALSGESPDEVPVRPGDKMTG